jgi:hypothetical protein
MNDHAVEMIGKIRAARAALHPIGSEHEVIDDELARATEQIGQKLAALPRLERVGLLNFDPGQLASRGAERVARFGDFLFAGKQRLARGEPFVS